MSFLSHCAFLSPPKALPMFLALVTLRVQMMFSPCGDCMVPILFAPALFVLLIVHPALDELRR